MQVGSFVIEVTGFNHWHTIRKFKLMYILTVDGTGSYYHKYIYMVMSCTRSVGVLFSGSQNFFDSSLCFKPSVH